MSFTLSNGAHLPEIGLGTFLSKKNEVENAVRAGSDSCQFELVVASYLTIPTVTTGTGFRLSMPLEMDTDTSIWLVSTAISLKYEIFSVFELALTLMIWRLLLGRHGSQKSDTLCSKTRRTLHHYQGIPWLDWSRKSIDNHGNLL